MGQGPHARRRVGGWGPNPGRKELLGGGLGVGAPTRVWEDMSRNLPSLHLDPGPGKRLQPVLFPPFRMRSAPRRNCLTAAHPCNYTRVLPLEVVVVKPQTTTSCGCGERSAFRRVVHNKEGRWGAGETIGGHHGRRVADQSVLHHRGRGPLRLGPLEPPGLPDHQPRWLDRLRDEGRRDPGNLVTGRRRHHGVEVLPQSRCPQQNDDGTWQTDADGLPVLGAEQSARQVIGRLSAAWRDWGERFGYFATVADAQAFEDEPTTCSSTRSQRPIARSGSTPV